MVAWNRTTAWSIFLTLFASCAVAASGAGAVDAALTSAEKVRMQREARLVVNLLQNYHYSGRSFREIENQEMVTRFLSELDPEDYFLSAADKEFLHRRFDHSLKTVYLFRGDLQPAFEIFDLYASRARERLAWITRRLASGFDFTLDEALTVKRPHGPPPPILTSDRRWELWLKDQVLREILAGRDLAAAIATVGRRYEEFGRQIEAIDALTVRERFFDAIIRSFDPHSGYFSADSAREFAQGMENAVAGVGLDLYKENGQCLVAAVQPGGPADLSSDIQPGDVIEVLRDGAPVDASRTPLRELVAMVRGSPGTKLQLSFHPPGATGHQVVTLERTRVLLGAERARGAVCVVPGPAGVGRRVAWIELPTFYASGENASATSAARDVRDLLKQMAAAQAIDGLVLDLRDNPGGALAEAVALSALFLPRGTVMLCRSPDGTVTDLDIDKGNKPAFSGPLIVLTSDRSASASEIFAGAMKAHQRALIVGAASTFGKGTVQNYVELAKARPGLTAADTANWGTLRLTSQRFYLPDGGSVQRDGVAADLALPVGQDSPMSRERESDLPHALAAEAITPPNRGFVPTPSTRMISDALRRRLRAQMEADSKDLPEWKLCLAETAASKAALQQASFSLQLTKRRSEQDEARAESLERLHRRRQLAAQVAYPTESFEISLLQPLLIAHEAKLRAAKGSDGQPLLHRLHHGLFMVETDRQHLRRLRLAAVKFRDFDGDTNELAAAFATGAGVTASPDQLKAALEDLDLLEHRTDEAVVECIATHLGGNGVDRAAVARGVDAFLQRLAEIDGEMLRERPGLDVPMREGLRLAAAWADAISPAARP